MRAENWQTVKGLLQDVLQIEPVRRHEFLQSNGASREVLSEVESLLALAAESDDFMSLTLDDYSKDFVAEAEISLVGQRIGIYEILSEIGCGGMGAVYLAARVDGKFEQRVAIKMLKREFNVERIRHNFRREKEILAKLAHPNIARLLDAGTTKDSIPYLVMEYVEGAPIDKFCERNDLALNARLKLFNRVCEAVSFAHRSLIVHRDLKPSNILVTATGEPKLLDFGISKLLDAAENAADQPATLLGAMTPEYAAPEQIKGEPVTTASDIYSLGIVLYKILTGALPFDLKGKTNGELRKIIAENAPTMPSAALNLGSKISNPENPQSAVRNPQLKGDIDNIILKALAKEPAQRYATVEQFSADLWRFVDGLPVLARPATFSYRARKLYGRNKVSVLAAAFVFVSLLTGLTVALWQASVARGQARLAADAQRQAESETLRAVAGEDKARAEQERAEKISRFVFKVLAYANPRWYAEGAKYNGETKVIEAMDELSDKIDVEFADQPDVQSELHHKFAEVYNSHKTGARAERAREKELFHARRALELRKRFYGARHELVAKDMFYLYSADDVEKTNEARYLMEAIQMMQETNPYNLNLPYMLEAYAARLILPGSDEFHEQYRQTAEAATGENRYRIAERLLLEALPIFRAHYQADNSAIFSNECVLAYARLKQNKFTEVGAPLEVCRAGMPEFSDEDRRYYSSLFQTIETNR